MNTKEVTMNTLILTNDPLRFKVNNTTIVNRENKYTDANGTIVQHCILAMLHGIRASKIIIYEPAMIDIRYKHWLCKRVIHCSTRDATFVYARNSKAIFRGKLNEFYRFIKETP
jgi:hypothetical protein